MASLPPPPLPPPALAPAPDESPIARDVPPWRAWTAPAALGSGLALGVFSTIVVELLASAAGSSLSHPTAVVSIIADVVFDLGFVVAALYFASRRSAPRPSDFGYRRVRWRVAVPAFVVAAVSYYVVTAIYGSLLGLHAEKLPRELSTGNATTAAVAVAAFVCVVAPIAEEFFFRGFFFGALRGWRIVIGNRDIGTWVAALLTGILFGAVHLGSAPAADLVPLGFLGFVLCILRWRTGSLYPCMALHSFNNSLALGVELHWTVVGTLALTLGSWLVIAVVTGPLGARSPSIV
jgi:membrane protease YdiL (CAAX protease family)